MNLLLQSTFFKIVSVTLLLTFNVSLSQTPNGTLDFGNPTSGTTATTGNTGFGGVRVGSGGGSFTLQNPGQSIGTLGELRGIASSTGSINSVGITSTEYGTAATTFTVSFDLYLSGGASGTWYFFAGNGTSFAAAQSTGFTGANVFSGLRWTFGGSNAITTDNRNAGAWDGTAFTGTPFAQNTAYSVIIIGNNSAATVNYTGGSVAANTYDLYINNVLVGNDLAKAQLAGSTSINAFRFYGENSTGSVAQLAMDNVKWYNTCYKAATAPTVTTNAATAVGTVGATLNGTVNANGLSTTNSFDYGTTASYGSTIAATPATLSTSTATAIAATLSSLSLNTQYFYRAVGTVSGTPTNGSGMSFYTLAATPGVLVVNNPLQTTLDLTVNATTQNSNPAATQYAIQETGGQYVQANGTLGASAVWQTAATWGTITVTGLSTSTTYTFQAKARNGATVPVETAFGGTASGTTLAPALVDWCNLQFPTSITIDEGQIFTVYARVYEPGITDSPGEGTAIDAWIGYSTTNGTPDGSWTWVSASYFGDDGASNDEYSAVLGAGITPGTYYFASRFQIGTGPYVYGGKNNAIWTSTADNAVLTVNSNLVDFANIQSPITATITQGNTVTVYAQVYEPGITNAAGQGTGITAQIGYFNADTTPDGTWTWLAATYNVDSGNNDEYQATLGAGLAPGTYYYASRFIKTGSTQYVYGGTAGNWTTGNSGDLTVNALGTPVATAATAADVTSFTANWDAVTDATSYRLDVSTSPIFSASTASGNTPWINEFHYDNVGGDIGEFVEIVVPNSYVGTNLTVTLYNGGNDQEYDSVMLSSMTVGNSTANQTIYYYNFTSGIQNGSPDGLALSDNSGLIEFLSYEGTFTATDGPAIGVLSTDIGQSEGGSAPAGYSLQLSGTGNSAADFTWQAEAIETKGSLNNAQTLTAPTTPSSAFVTGYENLNTGNVTTYDVTGLTQGTTYYYRVRAVLGANTSGNSNVIDVTTLPSSVTWNGTAWSNITGPTATQEAVIAGVYSTTTNGNITAKNIIVNSGSLTINPNTKVEIQNALVNNLTSSAVVVENNGVLKQVNNVANTGNITVKRNSSDIVRLDYTGWSSPVDGQNLYDFTPATLTNRFYEYNPSGNAYVAVSNIVTGVSGANFSIGKGYLLRAPNNWHPTTATPYAGEFKGVPNNGDITTGVSAGYNLIGNPYPSPISSFDFLTNSNNQGATVGMTTLYFWTHTVAYNNGTSSYPTNNYATHNGIAGVAAAAGGDAPDDYIQVGQGFLVDVTNSGVAEFNNSMRLDASNGQFFKNSGGINQTTSIEKHNIWLGLTSPGYSHNQILVGYVTGATNGFEASLDAKLFGQNNSVLYSPIGSDKFVIQSRALPFSVSDVVPLGLIAQSAGQYTISMDNFDGIFTGQDIFLRDNLLNVTHDIKGAPYTFASAAGDIASRFEIVYASPLTVETPTFNENSVIVYTNDSGININAGQTVINSVKVFDVRGRLLVSKSKVNASSITIENVSAVKQVLIVQITSEDNVTVSKKVVN